MLKTKKQPKLDLFKTKKQSKPDFIETKKQAKLRSADIKKQPKPSILEKIKSAHSSQFCLLHINKTKNNIHCVISTLFGSQKTLWSVSGGRIAGGGPNSRRKTRYTQRATFKTAIEKMLGFGLRYLILHCKGMIPSKRFILKTFGEHFTIVLLKDFTSVAHNGTQPPSKRRL